MTTPSESPAGTPGGAGKAAAGPSASRSRAPLLLVGAAVLFGLVLLLPDWVIPGPESNDRVAHKAQAQYASLHWHDQWPVDSWYPSIAAGFPVAGYYHPLSQLVASTLWQVVPRRVDPAFFYLGLCYLLLSFMPLVIYTSMRKLGLPRRTSALAGMLFPLLGTFPYYGIGWESYVHIGSGLLPQLWGAFFIFPALAWGYDAQRTGRFYAAGLLLAACSLSHLIYGYIAVVSLAILLLLPDPARPLTRRLRGALGTLLVTGAATAFFFVPAALHADLILRSRWEPAWKWDSYGAWEVMRQLVRGYIFDGRGLPVLSALMVVGLVAAALAAARHRDRLRLWILVCLAVWLLLYCGRATWGRALDYLPVPRFMHMHRLVGGVQIFGLPLAAIGLDAAWVWFRNRRRRATALLGCALLVALPAGSAVFRTGFMLQDAARATARRQALDRAPAFHELVGLLRSLPPGRVYAGMHYDWGSQFTIGDLPVYNHLQSAGFDMVGYPFNALAPPAEWQLHLDFGQLRYCDLYNIRYLVAPRGMSAPFFARPRAIRGRFVLYEIPTSGYFGLGSVESPPRDAFSEGSFRTASRDDIYRVGQQWLEGPGPAARRYWSMGLAPPPLHGPVEPGELREQVAPGRFRCRVRVPTDADLILKVTYHPYWRCTVDGRHAKVARIFPGFMAVHVDPGEHDVHFVYRPPYWKRVLFWLALAMLAGGPIALVTRRFRGR